MPTSRTLLTATAVLLALAGCSASEEPAAAPTAPSTTAAAAPDEMRFTFTGEAGEAGCRYDGPRTVRTGASSVLENRSDQVEARVTLARLAPDASPADFEAYLAGLGGTPPVLAPEADHDPAVHAWMQGFWIQVHVAAPGAAQSVTSPVTETGEYVAFCVHDAPGGASAIWPAGHVSVTRG